SALAAGRACPLNARAKKGGQIAAPANREVRQPRSPVENGGPNGVQRPQTQAVQLRDDVRGPRTPRVRRRPFATRGTPQYRLCSAENGSQTLEHAKVIRPMHRAQVLRLELLWTRTAGGTPIRAGGALFRAVTTFEWTTPSCRAGGRSRS